MINESYSRIIGPIAAKGNVHSAWRYLTGLVFIIGLLALPVFKDLWQLWHSDKNFEGFLLVPVLCAIIFYRRKNEFAQCRPQPVKWLFYLLQATLAAMFFASKYGFPRVAGLLLVVNLLIAFLSILGYSNSKLFVGSFLFLMLMVPPPQLVVNFLTVSLQGFFSTIMEKVLLEFSDLFIGRRGFEFWFDGIDHPMIVASVCSGIRSLLGLVMISLFISVFDRHSITAAILMITAGVVITLVLNFLRIFVTIQMRLFGLEEYSVGFWHGLLGIAVFIVGCVILNRFSAFLKSLTIKVKGMTGEN
jgi:exosortase